MHGGEGPAVPRGPQVEAGERDVVTIVGVELDAPDEETALRRCASLAERLGVRPVRVEALWAQQREVHLARVDPLPDGEAADAALRSRGAAALELLGWAGQVELDGEHRRSVGLSFADRTGLVGEDADLSLVVRMGDAAPDASFVRLWAEDDGEPVLTDEETEELLAWARMVDMAKAVLVVDVRGLEPAAAREAAREIAVRAVPVEPVVGDPEEGPDGTVRVTAGLAMSDDPLVELLDEVLDRLGRDGWEVVRSEDRWLEARWRAADGRTEGIAELTLQVSPDVAY